MINTTYGCACDHCGYAEEIDEWRLPTAGWSAFGWLQVLINLPVNSDRDRPPTQRHFFKTCVETVGTSRLVAEALQLAQDDRRDLRLVNEPQA